MRFSKLNQELQRKEQELAWITAFQSLLEKVLIGGLFITFVFYTYRLYDERKD